MQDHIGKNYRNTQKNTFIYSFSCRSKPVWSSFFCGTQKKIFWIFQQFLSNESQEGLKQLDIGAHWLPLSKKHTFMFHKKKECELFHWTIILT